MMASEILQKLQEIEKELENMPVKPAFCNYSKEYPYDLAAPTMILHARTRVALAIDHLEYQISQYGDKNLECYNYDD